VQCDALSDIGLGLLKGPERQINHLYRGGRVALLLVNLSPVPVTEQGADLHRLNLHALGLVNHPRINVLLGYPVGLVIHQRPDGSELVVGDLADVAAVLLQVDGSG
jgi:hypothetical protein